MRENLTNQEGNATIYFIWLLGIVAIIFLLLINIAKIFVVSNQASNSVEQAALAGTTVLITETTEAIEDFDNHPGSVVFLAEHGGKNLEQLVAEKQQQYTNGGLSSSQAYIKALNAILSDEIDDHVLLKHALREHLENNGSLIPQVTNAIQSIIDDNQANPEDTQWVLSDQDWRVEVEATATFETISDHDIIPSFQRKIPGKGYGPSLDYLEKVYN